MSEAPLLMIPGPVEVSEGVAAAGSTRPPGHLDAGLVAATSRALMLMRRVWLAGEAHRPFIVSGSGTTVMEMAVCNLCDPGDHVLLVDTGYFSQRLGEMLRRRGAEVAALGAEPGDAPPVEQVRQVLGAGAFKALFATHVDTSTGVRVDAAGLCAAAQEHGVLTVFDGVCATGAERLETDRWGVDVGLTASQKALGLPPGLGLMVAGPRALEVRRSLRTPPPLVLDWLAWEPVMEAYETRRPAYFATPATQLLLALEVGLQEILADGEDDREAMESCFARHARAAAALRAAWEVLGLVPVPLREELAANTLSALRYPPGVGPDLLRQVAAQGVVVAGGLHPQLKEACFRVGHMGEVTRHPALLLRTVSAVARGLAACGAPADEEAAVAAASAVLEPA